MTYEEALQLSHSESVRHKRSPKDEEHRLQCMCVSWFNIEFKELRGLLFAIPNGGYRDDRTAARLKAEGVVAGVADLFLSIGNQAFHGLYIEMKTSSRGSRQSECQKVFQRNVERRRYKYVVCKTIDDFKATINGYLYGEKTESE